MNKKVQVRYLSRSGNTKALATAIASALDVKPISIDEENSLISENTDVLFIGGALYAYGIDDKLKKYIESLDSSKIKKAVVFSTSWISKHSIDLIKKALKQNNIDVVDKYIYYKNMPKKEELTEAAEIARSIVDSL